MPFTWTSPDPLTNKAKTRSIFVTELQDAVNVNRLLIGLSPITFIDQKVGKSFRYDAIEELKTTANDLAILYGYPTGVQDPLLLGRDWVEITKKFGKYVCHYPILNDLRTVLNKMELQEFLLWSQTQYTYPPTALSDTVYFRTNSYNGSTIPLLSYSDTKPWELRSIGHILVDDTYLYDIASDSPQIIKMALSDYSVVATKNLYSPFIATYDTTIDENYIYIMDNDGFVRKINKNTLSLSSSYDLKTIITYEFGQYPRGITCDDEYLYITGGRYKDRPPGRALYKGTVVKLKKDFSSFSWNSFALDYYGYSKDIITVDMFRPATDEDYLYVKYNEGGQNASIPYDPYNYTALLRISKDTLVGSIAGITFDATDIVSDGTYLYARVLHHPYPARVYTNTGVLLYSNTLSTPFNETNTAPASKYEYNISKVLP